MERRRLDDVDYGRVKLWTSLVVVVIGCCTAEVVVLGCNVIIPRKIIDIEFEYLQSDQVS